MIITLTKKPHVTEIVEIAKAFSKFFNITKRIKLVTEKSNIAEIAPTRANLNISKNVKNHQSALKSTIHSISMYKLEL